MPTLDTIWAGIDWSADLRDEVIDHRRIRYVERGAGPPLVLLHGLAGCWQTWLRNLPVLAMHHRVIAVDLPGFGESEPLAPPAEMSEHAHVVGVLLDRLGVSDATVVGHSMGGLVAFQLLAARPDLVHALVLANGGGIPLSPRRLALVVGGFKVFHRLFVRPSVMRAAARRPRLRRALFAGFTGGDEVISAAFAAMIVPAIDAPGFLDAVISAGQIAGGVRPESITVPVGLLWGERDPILPLDEARRLGAALPDATFVPIPGAGHCPMFERPQPFNEALLAFTSRLGPRRSLGVASGAQGT